MYFIDEVTLRIAELREKIQSKEYSYRMRPDARSCVWNVFYAIVNENDEEVDQFYYCIKCHEIKYRHGSEGTTTQLLRHRCVTENTTRKSIEPIDTVFIEKLKEAAAKFVCLDLRPMYALEGDGIRELFMAGFKMGKRYPKMSVENLMEHFPTRKSVKTVIATVANDAKQKIKAMFKSAIEEGGFGCTVDMWTDKHRHNTYMGMTANVYISTDECIEQKRIVFNMEHISEIVKSKDLLKSKIVGIFNEFDVTPEEIKNYITLTTDR